MHEAVKAESESRINNESLMAKDARIQQALTRKTAITQKLQLEATMQTQLLQASGASRASLQLRLDKANANNLELEKSCLELLNTVSEKEKEITDAQLQLSQQDSWASQDVHSSNEQWEDLQLQKLKLKRASPAKKSKSRKMKKVRSAPKGASVEKSAPPTDIDLQIQARKAFPIEYGDRGPERRAREGDIAILYEKLVRQRDGETSEIEKGVATSSQEDLTSAEESGPETRHLANIFAWKYSKSRFIPCDTFKGARKGYSFKLGPKGLGYYSDAKKKRSSQKAQDQEVTTVTETDSDENDDPPSTPSSASEYADDFSPRQPGESIAAMRLRLDNEHWDAHGKPHPQSGFQVRTAPPSSASSNSSSSSTSKLQKKSKTKTLRNSKTKKSSKSVAKSRVAKNDTNSNSDSSDTDEVEDLDMDC